MAVYMFKFKNSEENWHGIVGARSVSELFNIIDEFGDPYSCLIKKLDPEFGVCFTTVSEEDDDNEGEYFTFPSEKLELSESVSYTLSDETGWIEPNFKKVD